MAPVSFLKDDLPARLPYRNSSSMEIASSHSNRQPEKNINNLLLNTIQLKGTGKNNMAQKVLPTHQVKTPITSEEQMIYPSGGEEKSFLQRAKSIQAGK